MSTAPSVRMPAVHFRHWGPFDRHPVDDCMVVMRAAFDPAFGEAWNHGQLVSMLRSTGSHLITAHRHDDVIGFALLRTILDEAELLLLAVHPDARRRGIGALLLDKADQLLRRNGIARCFLEMRDGNDAVTLYAACGYTICGRRPDYYRGTDGQSRDAITLQRIY